MPDSPQNYKLRILHISDLHNCGPDEGVPARRRRVLGKAWDKNLDDILKDGPIDIVVFTGDAAKKGREYDDATTGFFEDVLTCLDLKKERLFVVPGNHDVFREIHKTQWKKFRDVALDPRTDMSALSDWMAGVEKEPLPGFKQAWRDEILERETNFWNWVKSDLGRPELLPQNSPHKYLGYRYELKLDRLPFPVYIIGLDSSWLSGERHEDGKLLLTETQVYQLTTDSGGNPLPGLRLASMHHPFGALNDGNVVKRLLAEYTNLVLRGHVHKESLVIELDPEQKSYQLGAGCLYGAHKGANYNNSCHVISLKLDKSGRPLKGEVHIRSWSTKGHWFNDDGVYRGSKNGRLTLPYLEGPVEDRAVTLFTKNTVLENRFEIEMEVGSGGMSLVYKAFDRNLRKSVAVKTLLPHYRHDKKSRQTLENEVRSCRELSHPNIVSVYDLFIDSAIPFFTMEYVEGKTLDAYLENKGKLSPEDFFEPALAILDAVAYSHRLGIVHRDLKSKNIMLDENGVIKVMDFGIAQSLRSTYAKITADKPNLSIRYASPQQIKGEPADVRDDIYSLGCLFYEMLSGRPPFSEGMELYILKQHLEEKPKPLPRIPWPINMIIQKCLAKEREKRYGSVEELAQAIKDLKEKPELLKTGSLPETWFNELGMQFRLIPAGSFMMGASPDDSEARDDERPQHRVEITRPFYIGVYEVTQEQYELVMGSNPSRFKGSRRPVECVDWDEAKMFCRMLGKMTGEKYRLPSEAEWEFACRAGTTTKYYWGDNVNGDYGWYADNSKGETHEVGRKQPNDWGLYDMSGNVWEWCQDWYDAGYYSRSPSKDPVGPPSGNVRVLRGGSWGDDARHLRSSVRDWVTPDDRNSLNGFRIVREVE
jgi:formylglycine-generating enzyme required for sulfatase activity/tRNA A-37 threonylcarbamoyl transferase component Bud32